MLFKFYVQITCIYTRIIFLFLLSAHFKQKERIKSACARKYRIAAFRTSRMESSLKLSPLLTLRLTAIQADLKEFRTNVNVTSVNSSALDATDKKRTSHARRANWELGRDGHNRQCRR